MSTLTGTEMTMLQECQYEGTSTDPQEDVSIRQFLTEQAGGVDRTYRVSSGNQRHLLNSFRK